MIQDHVSSPSPVVERGEIQAAKPFFIWLVPDAIYQPSSSVLDLSDCRLQLDLFDPSAAVE